MFQAMKYLDDVVVKSDSIEEQLENLDIGNVFHLMWVYRNITYIHKHSETKFREIINGIKELKINDYYPASTILQFLNQLIYRIYSLKHDDNELIFVKDKCGYSEVVEEEDLSSLKEFIFPLCLPIVGLHTKEVVDIMAYVYELDGCEHFDNLFEVFEKSNDILIELHLHKVRISRKRHKKCDKKEKQIEDNKVEVDFKDVDSEITKEMENLTIKGNKLGAIEGDIGDKKPFESLEELHLQKAKNLLLNFVNPSLKFYIENLALYLSLDYDEEIFVKFINFTTGGYKSICAKKIFKLTQVPEDKLGILISSMEGVEKDILRADDLIIFPQTFKMYVNWFVSSSKGISIALVSDYVDIARLFILFARKYRHPSLFKVVKSLWECDIPNIEDQVKLTLIECFSEIVEIFIPLEKTKGASYGKALEESFTMIDTLLSEPVNIRDTIQKMITDITPSYAYKKAFVHHLSVLKIFPQKFIDETVDALLKDFDLDWRYRLNLLEKCYENHEALRLDFQKILSLFTKDKVFYVRMKAVDIESKINQTTQI